MHRQASEIINDATLRSRLIESFCAMELLRQSAWAKQWGVRIFHYRTSRGVEVDLVLEGGAGRLVGVEIKAAAVVDSNDFKGLRALAEATDERFLRGVVLYLGEKTWKFGKNLWAVPISALWQN